MRELVEAGRGRPNIVVPTIRNNSFFENFLNNWKEEFAGCHLIVIEDREKKQLKDILQTHSTNNNYTYELYDWKDIDKDLKANSWIIPRKTDCVRNYGYLMAYKNKPLFIVTLDDDLEPLKGGHIMKFYNKLNQNVFIRPNYMSTMNNDLPRGVIEDSNREVAVVHGCWVMNADYSAKQQIKYEGKRTNIPSDFYCGVVPRGAMFSMCGMNLAWRPDFTKYMYFPLMGGYNGYPVDRCGDIWCGYYMKKNADELNLAVLTGEPFVIHKRASNPWTNHYKEENGEWYGIVFDDIFVKGNNAIQLNNEEEKYFNTLKRAYKIWDRLIGEIDNDNL